MVAVTSAKGETMRRNSTRHTATIGAVLGGVSLVLLAFGGRVGVVVAQAGPGHTFGAHSAKITNPYLPITKFHRCVLAGNDQGQHLRIVRALQSRTKSFRYRGQKVKTAVVKDRVTDVGRGQLIEKTVDYFAQDKAGNVYYFGEDVNEYRNGHLVSHEGQWRLGRDTNKPGVVMPAHPTVGDSFYAENIPGIAVEKDRIVASGKTRRIAGHTYRHVIKIREHATTPKPAEVEYKTYAPGTGVITEANGGVRLVSCS
jgi:hypothetical protein